MLLIFVFISNLSALAKESVVCSLDPNDSGIQPNASLVADKDGNLYRTTSNQGFRGYGAVFELMPNSDGTGTETTLCAFIGGSDGAYPWRESLSVRLAISVARPSAAATDKVCRETVCLRFGP